MEQVKGTHRLDAVLMASELLGEPRTESKPPNRQLFENSRLSGSATELNERANPDRLYGEARVYDKTRPNLAILSEQPWHRAVVYMKVQGCTNREIAARFDKTEAWISQLTRQPWFRERVVEELKTTGRNLVEEAIKVEILPSIQTLVELRDGAESEQVRFNSARDLVDRFLGKPTQRVESKSTGDFHHTVETVADLDRELAKVEKQLGGVQTREVCLKQSN